MNEKQVIETDDLISREKLIENIKLLASRSSLGETRPDSISVAEVISLILDAPAVDVVEVVRCKDCKWLNVVNNDNLFAHCVKTGYMFLPFQTDIRTHFCSFWGRMDSENED